MANTYSQINIHSVFSVKGRENIITKNFRNELHSYMSGILKNDGCYPLSVGGWSDHVHVFYELPLTSSIASQMRMLKATSSKWINDQKFVKGKFSWQEGYAAFSYSHSQRHDVIQYITHQEEHHKKQTFKEEYLGMLNKFEIDFEDNYVFDFYE